MNKCPEDHCFLQCDAMQSGKRPLFRRTCRYAEDEGKTLVTQRFGDWILSAIGTSSIDWAQLSRFYLKTQTEYSLRNVVF
jgi:hypothetical protein